MIEAIFAKSLAQESAEGFYQRRQVVLDRVPDDGGAKIPIGVHGEVAQVDHLAPGDFVVRAGDFRGDVICGLADDGEVVNDSVDDFLVVFKGLEIRAGNIALDFGDRVEDVLDAEGPVSRRHRWLHPGCALSTPA